MVEKDWYGIYWETRKIFLFGICILKDSFYNNLIIYQKI